MKNNTNKVNMDNLRSFTSPIRGLPLPPVLPVEVDKTKWYRKPSWHQLIIIGNGFDLECGLPSRYGDFFESRWQVISDIEEALRGEADWKAPCNTGVSVWELILRNKCKEYWYSIESAVREWVVPHDDANGNSLSHAEAILAAVNPDDEKRNRPSDELARDEAVALVAEYIKKTHESSKLSKWNLSDVYAFLLSELHSLEHEFSTYLQEQVEQCDDYTSRADQLMIDLIHDELLEDMKDYDVKGSILSFNYTRPFESIEKDCVINLSNVHGSLEKNEIIFGIDGSDCMDLDGVLEFTKTYRLMALGCPDMSEVVHHTSPVSGGSSTNLIKFYGHSLADPDYSYFQAIFDTVGLYASNTRLIFYFKPYKRGDGSSCTEEEARDSVMKNVFKLLATYGKTMGNEDHGKNLIHKLLLEGRLSVKLLPQEKRNYTRVYGP